MQGNRRCYNFDLMLMAAIRSLCERAGYVLWKREFIRYGVEPFLDMQRLCRAWRRPVNTFFDVGANVGQTVGAAREAFPSARIFSFEPHPVTFQRLRAAIPASELFSAHQLAFSDKEGTATFYEYATEGDGTHINSLVPNARFPTQRGYMANQITVPCSTIDTFCAENSVKCIDVLKMDTEGSELFVLQGAQAMLRNGSVGLIFTEYNALLPQEGTTGGSLLPIAEFLHSLGYEYLCCYTDRIDEVQLFASANALFAHQKITQ